LPPSRAVWVLVGGLRTARGTVFGCGRRLCVRARAFVRARPHVAFFFFFPALFLRLVSLPPPLVLDGLMHARRAVGVVVA